MSKLAGSRADYLLPEGHALLRVQRTGLILGAIGLALSCLGLVVDRERFFQSWLLAYLYWLGPTLGSMGILMLQHITGGRWGVALRRTLEAGMKTLPLMALFFLPIVAGMEQLFEWMHADVVARDAILQHKSIYLNRDFFLLRAGFYFVVWFAVAFGLSRWSIQQDDDPSPSVDRRLHYLSRAGLMLYALTMTFAAVDWAMSLEPHWYSHIYGVIVIGGQILTAMMFAVVVAASLARVPRIGEFVNAERFHDFGKLLLAFIMLWAYFAFSQFLIIWSANLPEETPWYLTRRSGAWQLVAVALILFHFVVPFVLLLSRSLKRTPPLLSTIVLGLLGMRYVDLYWLVAPSFQGKVFSPHWLDLATLLGIGGIWLALFVRLLRPHPLLPLNDPYYQLSDFEHEAA
jgi:hypothetical protein